VSGHAKVGHRVTGKIKEVKGHCHASHKVGDHFELDVHSGARMCGFLYHSAFPYLLMLQFGGGFPADWGDPDIVVLDCPDKQNAVTLEMKRSKE
jgi:uncharacterized repeat protein (TIGR04076 family)